MTAGSKKLPSFVMFYESPWSGQLYLFPVGQDFIDWEMEGELAFLAVELLSTL